MWVDWSKGEVNLLHSEYEWGKDNEWEPSEWYWKISTASKLGRGREEGPNWYFEGRNHQGHQRLVFFHLIVETILECKDVSNIHSIFDVCFWFVFPHDRFNAYSRTSSKVPAQQHAGCSWGALRISKCCILLLLFSSHAFTLCEFLLMWHNFMVLGWCGRDSDNKEGQSWRWI